jgi:hypothetical protein
MFRIWPLSPDCDISPAPEMDHVRTGKTTTAEDRKAPASASDTNLRQTVGLFNPATRTLASKLPVW